MQLKNIRTNLELQIGMTLYWDIEGRYGKAKPKFGTNFFAGF